MQAGVFSPPGHCQPLQYSGLFSSQRYFLDKWAQDGFPNLVRSWRTQTPPPFHPTQLRLWPSLRPERGEGEGIGSLPCLWFHQEDLLSRSLQQTSIAGRPTLRGHLWLPSRSPGH